MGTLIGRLLCAVGIHSDSSVGWFVELLVGRAHFFDWRKCQRCCRVKVTATLANSEDESEDSE